MASKFIIGFCLVMFLVCLLNAVLAKPAILTTPQRTDCEVSEATDVLCQTCAKITKSELAYPMCCDNTEYVRDWCRDYVNFGLQIPKQKLHTS